MATRVVTLTVNGETTQLLGAEHRTLLDVLRHDF